MTTRHDDMDGGVTAATIEQETEGAAVCCGPLDEDVQFWHARWHEAADRAEARLLAARLWKEVARRNFQYRALARAAREFYRGVARKFEESRDAAVQERDEATAELAEVGLNLDRLRAVLDTTTRQRDKADERLSELSQKCNRQSEKLADLRALVSALTEPPARHPEAEAIEAVLADSPLDPKPVRRELANFLAERGVRVTGGDDR